MAVYTLPRRAVGVSTVGSAVLGIWPFPVGENREKNATKDKITSADNTITGYCSCNQPKCPCHL